MKHNIRFKRLSRDSKHRKALCKNISRALLIYKKIQTTKPKSDAILFLVNKLITKFKELSSSEDYRQKIALIKKFVDSHNPDTIRQIIDNIDGLANGTNHVQRIPIFKIRPDSADLVVLSLI